jgi:integrating conjugative element protein (TIGR03755 family)
MKLKKITTAVLISVLSHAVFANAPLYRKTIIPGDNSLYYEIGGGNTMPLPYAPDETDIDIDVLGNAGLGYNCGKFNTINSIADSLNGIKNSFTNLESQVVSDAEGAILELPAYELAKHMPNVYRLLQDGVANGQFDFGVATKSCQEMVSQIGQGVNPYHNWAEASMGDKWKHYMSYGDSQGIQSGLLGDSSGDINQAKQNVADDNGKSGVQWFYGSSQDGGYYAGGEGQPAINIVSDVVIAGYNTLINKNRSLDDKSAPPDTEANEVITVYFSTPVEAAKWVTNVVGEQVMTTYPGGNKKSIPGKGLSKDINSEIDSIKPTLTGMVQGSMPINLDNLKAVSTNTVAINDSFIRKLQNISDPLTRVVTINTISQRIAGMRVLNKAKLAMNILQVGSEEPVVLSNKAAEQSISFYQQRLQYWIDTLRASPKDNSEILTSPMVKIMNIIDQNEASDAAIQPSKQASPIMEKGAVGKGH